VPFYVYEFESVSGYATAPAVVERLRDRAPNLAGMKVSDSPFAKVSPYLAEGLDVFVGAEGLIAESLAAGAAGSVSGLATAFPELVADAVRTGAPEASARLDEIRTGIDRFPRHAALKLIAKARGVLIAEDVRPPLRGLRPAEREELARLTARWLALDPAAA
jgi:4-hydroxy-tetrahydrodipicolinate synthase